MHENLSGYVGPALSIAQLALSGSIVFGIGLGFLGQGSRKKQEKLARIYGLEPAEAAHLYRSARDPFYSLLRLIGGLTFILMGVATMLLPVAGYRVPIAWFVIMVVGPAFLVFSFGGLLSLFKGETIVRLRRLDQLAQTMPVLEEPMALPSLKPDRDDVARTRFLGLACLGLAAFMAWQFIPLLPMLLHLPA